MSNVNLQHFRKELMNGIKCVAILLLITLSSFSQSKAQGLNKPFYDYSRVIHFGFQIGTSYGRLKYDFSPLWYAQDTFLSVSSVGSPGFTIGAVANLHLGSTRSYLREHFDLRFIPALVLTQRNFIYTFRDSTTTTKTVESALIEGPLLLKFKSDRFTNVRFYTVAGINYSFDLSSEYKATKNPNNPKVAIVPNQLSYEYGVGLDLYFPFFKFSPEIKLSKGINNVLVPDVSPYSGIFSRLRSNFIYFSLYFEG
jgi:hypothetical protein